ncbi:RidA family protein [Flagellimonas eckloniae]|uniref:Endoribonuclease L-PSP n=1 Tax=Flagellimonas eckloniae TaxID=346185 RepID=A0A0Q0X103_9FLAO|nr:RidA family protein [Allomuricauda eckloniae]KQC31286.1 endoribonuclease L-PSP [Allomuricauda eckloniae]
MKTAHYLFLSIFMSGIFTCLYSQEKTNVVFHKTHEEKKLSAPYSDAVQVGNVFYLSGQIGMDHSTRTLVEGGIEAETKKSIKNIEEVLAQHGMTLDNVVKCTVILNSISDYNVFNGVYSKFFPKKPARTTMAASGLPRNAKVEIEVIAVQ